MTALATVFATPIMNMAYPTAIAAAPVQADGPFCIGPTTTVENVRLNLARPDILQLTPLTAPAQPITAKTHAIAFATPIILIIRAPAAAVAKELRVGQLKLGLLTAIAASAKLSLVRMDIQPLIQATEAAPLIMPATAHAIAFARQDILKQEHAVPDIKKNIIAQLQAAINA